MDYSQKMQLAEALWKELKAIFELAIDSGRHLTIKFDAYHEVTVTGPYKEAVKDAVHVAEQKESARQGETALWDLRTIHYLKKHIVAHGLLQMLPSPKEGSPCQRRPAPRHRQGPGAFRLSPQ